MDVLSLLGQGFAVALQPTNLLVAFIGAFVGTLIGALPGLGPVNGSAILLPFCFALGLPPETALILLAAVYYGCEYGGRITSILLNVPGEAASVLTALDGYPMARKGLAGPAMSISGFSSFIGSTVATVGLTLFAPIIAAWALKFGPAEYFALMVFALCMLTSLVGNNPAKTMIGCVIGLLISTVGIDSGTGVYRFTFGDVHLADGIAFLIVVVGLFSISEVLLLLEETHAGVKLQQMTGRMLFSMAELARCGWGILRTSVMGFVVGVLPGAGASVAAALAYMTEKKLVDREGTFGSGDIRGVAAPEAANNAAAGGAFIPMLTLGIPGSGTTAVMLGGLTLYNITPGPLLFEQQPGLVWGLIASLYIANVMLLVLNLPFIGLFIWLLRIPTWALVPGIVAVSFIGVYSVHSTVFDLLLMIGFGVLGYVLRKLDFSLAPVVLGVVLGDMMEQNLRRALSISGGDWTILVGSPISMLLWGLALFVLFLPLLTSRLKRARLAG